eukprot:Gregarina_sp_Pseudo_9__678@NODE_1430_length_1610_cov_36_968810_g1328_i0_p1_GENE_NODE_1430_length_1610_cov_36_968810_g1328_i0NODE_1430_length_1610_cov_36_968810_g1328_i0_p1_ORF_typecomplete_len331_score39_40HIM1/PF08732_10/1_1e27NAD_binding_10/PF13460_6/5_8e11NmrA/PF05368_13/1_2e05Epimerase/PF01370_21/3_1e05Semialdhyde_dh/PF01118_24/8_8e05RmlD_sub_bind/PF04321_17/0_21_NODE_1430_length_1610_cov_36_968810_g1328_i0117995
MDPFSVCVIGSTGAVGKEVIRCLVEYFVYSNGESKDELPPLSAVYSYARRDTTVEYYIPAKKLETNPELREGFHKLVKLIKMDFEDPPRDFGKGCQVMISCMGSVVSKVGKAMQYKIDHDYTVNLATLARQNGVSVCAAVSVTGANPNSWTFYIKTRGEMEEDLKKLQFSHLVIARPGMILAEREDPRPFERFFVSLMVLDPCNYMSVSSSDIANSMTYVVLKRALELEKCTTKPLEAILTTEATPQHQANQTEEKAKIKATETGQVECFSSRQMTLTSKIMSKYLTKPVID